MVLKCGCGPRHLEVNFLARLLSLPSLTFFRVSRAPDLAIGQRGSESFYFYLPNRRSDTVALPSFLTLRFFAERRPQCTKEAPLDSSGPAINGVESSSLGRSSVSTMQTEEAAFRSFLRLAPLRDTLVLFFPILW
jgi:hypothetical protein